MKELIIPFLLTLFAGLATGVGSCISLLTKTKNTKFLSISLGFSAGVMIYISFVELFSEARRSLSDFYGNFYGEFFAIIALFLGMFLIAIIDKFIPEKDNPHEPKDITDYTENSNSLYKMGILSAIAISIHNFPEGMVTFMSSLENYKLGIPIAFAIALHNIPEGIAVSIPIYYSTGSRKKAFYYSFLSGISEPIGGIVGYLIFKPFINKATLGFIFASIAGIMIFISLDELLPSAEKYGEHHLAVYGILSGMIVISISLLFFS